MRNAEPVALECRHQCRAICNEGRSESGGRGDLLTGLVHRFYASFQGSFYSVLKVLTIRLAQSVGAVQCLYNGDPTLRQRFLDAWDLDLDLTGNEVYMVEFLGQEMIRLSEDYTRLTEELGKPGKSFGLRARGGYS